MSRQEHSTEDEGEPSRSRGFSRKCEMCSFPVDICLLEIGEGQGGSGEGLDGQGRADERRHRQGSRRQGEIRGGTMSVMVQVSELHFSTEEGIKVLEDIHLHVERGEMAFVVGAASSGRPCCSGCSARRFLRSKARSWFTDETSPASGETAFWIFNAVSVSCRRDSSRYLEPYWRTSCSSCAHWETSASRQRKRRCWPWNASGCCASSPQKPPTSHPLIGCDWGWRLRRATTRFFSCSMTCSPDSTQANRRRSVDCSSGCIRAIRQSSVPRGHRCRCAHIGIGSFDWRTGR